MRLKQSKLPDEQYDVVVVGAGFGGPVAAKKCAEAGLRTLMLERSEQVGEKVVSGLTIPFYGFLFGPAFIRDGNPPVERPVDGIINYIIKDVDTGDIDIDDSLKIPKPLSPVIAFGYNAYCKPFCQWEADQAVAAGAELRTSLTAVDVIREDSVVTGIVTEDGRRINCQVVINAEGSQGVLAIKAGVREKYPPETISLADVYDYEMAKEDVDRIFGHSLRFCWGWDEQQVAPPLGHGNGLMVWPYHESVHFMQDQCLRMDDGPVPNLRKLFDVYHTNLTTKLPWWSEEVAPNSQLRARMWEGFEIFVGLDPRLRGMPNHTGGMMLVGDAAGLESTELCDGVPAAWFSADIAADVAIEAIRTGDTSAAFLKRYDERVSNHPIIHWSIRGRNRYDLREAQKNHDEALLKKLVHNGWGLGGFTHMTGPLLEAIFDSVREDPAVPVKWIKMWFRYYYNWQHQSFGERRTEVAGVASKKRLSDKAVGAALNGAEAGLKLAKPVVKLAADLLRPLARVANPVMKVLLPAVEPLYAWALRFTEPALTPVSDRLVGWVDKCDPAIFECRGE